jgi:hypothetical protein
VILKEAWARVCTRGAAAISKNTWISAYALVRLLTHTHPLGIITTHFYHNARRPTAANKFSSSFPFNSLPRVKLVPLKRRRRRASRSLMPPHLKHSQATHRPNKLQKLLHDRVVRALGVVVH